jgi:hypothetical protein
MPACSPWKKLPRSFALALVIPKRKLIHREGTPSHAQTNIQTTDLGFKPAFVHSLPKELA